MKKKLILLAAFIMSICMILAGCSNLHTDTKWKTDKSYDTTLPDLANAGESAENANDAGWYATLIDNFDYKNVAEMEESGIWTTSPHAIRWESNNNKDYENNYWCPDMVSFNNGMVEIKSEQRTDHICSQGICPKVGRFTSGIETRKVIKKDDTAADDDNKGNSDDLLWSQAFGYFEARVKFPKAEGLWSAFWLQSSNQRKIGNEGVDGTEIDIYESAFIKNPKQMGHALLWDGYGKYGKVDGTILDTGKDLYDGFHTFALKWTPEYYVFYIDGVPTWASRGGGVSKVKEFIRLTVEIDAGDKYGPHGQKIGAFKDGITPIFYIDYVKVYQNKNYEKFIIDDDNFPGNLDGDN